MMRNKKVITLIMILAVTMLVGCSEAKDSGTNDIETKEQEVKTEVAVTESVSDEQAIEAIRNYCCTVNPDLEKIAAEEYPVYWAIESSDDNEIVVLFRSYTGALVRYYIDRATGITNSTEFVEGITEEEEPTGESFDIRDYID